MIKKILQRPNLIPITIILLCSIFICLPLLSSEIDITYDDGIQHIARLIGTESSIQEGQNEIMSDFCNGFGYSWNLFYSPLTAFIPLIFRIFGCSYIDCIKLFMFVITFISGMTMYFFTKDVTKSKKISVVAAIIYIFAPYRFTDMYIRNALAELTTFAFIPMVFQGIYGIIKNKPKREIILIIGTVLLILTHTIVTIFVAIICFIYLLTQFKKLKRRGVIEKLVLSGIIIVLITSFFWIPLLQVRNSAEYEVFKPGRMERQDVLIALKLDIEDLIFTRENDNMIYEIGLLNILVLISTPFVIKKLKKKYKKTEFYNFYIFAIVITSILLIMTLKLFPFEYLPDILRMIQFTFRLLEFTSFFIAFIVGVNIVNITRRINFKYILPVIIIILMFITLMYKSHLYYSNNINEDWLIPAVAVTEKTGRVHAGCASFEYLPTKAFENRNYIETRSNEVIILNGEAEITDYNKNKSKLEFNLKTEEAEFELPYIYYPGYTVKIEDQNIETYETEKGFIGIKVKDVDNKKVKVEYTGTILMKISKITSILGIILCILLIVKDKFIKKQER